VDPGKGIKPSLRHIEFVIGNTLRLVFQRELVIESSLTEKEFFGAEFFYCVAEFGGFFEFEFFGGFAHVGF
jgi:hypothetical protein